MKKRITIVEDDADILFAVAAILSNATYEVTALTSGQTILHGNYIRTDLFIIDKRMPDMDGLDICRYLRSTPENHDVPVIIISASPKFELLAKEAGANGFLSKPFQMKALLDIVARHLK
jgi:DNA-binding response OmpR family regulator